MEFNYSIKEIGVSYRVAAETASMIKQVAKGELLLFSFDNFIDERIRVI